MRICAKYLLPPLLALLLVVPIGFAQDAPTPPAAPAFTQQELDQMLAPIALYPDSLLSQILMAATYPLEVVQAARWSKANAGMQGEQAVRAVEDRDWDPSVKSLVAFPQILSMMDEKLDWTERMGDAFLAQPSQVMDTVQGLRQKADAAGNLKSTEHQRVERQDRTIVVTSVYPDVIYVPYYDPFVVYGPWWWPAYRPIYWAPWPGYYVRPGFVFYWGVAIHIGPRFFYGHCDWRQRHIVVVDVHPFYYKRPAPPRKIWVHEHEHRRGVPYRDPSVHKQYVKVNTPARRADYRVTRPLPDARKPDDSRNLPGNERGKGDGNRPGHVVPKPDGDRHPSPKANDAPTRVRAPVERPESKRPEMSAPVSRPEPREHKGREHVGAPERGAEVDRGRGSWMDSGGGARDAGESGRGKR